MVRLIDRVYLIQNDALSYFLAVLYVQIINLDPPGENKKIKKWKCERRKTIAFEDVLDKYQNIATAAKLSRYFNLLLAH